jgi:hypothetical protein
VREHGAKRGTGGVGGTRTKSSGENHESDGDDYENVPREGNHTMLTSNLSATLSRAMLTIGAVWPYARDAAVAREDRFVRSVQASHRR